MQLARRPADHPVTIRTISEAEGLSTAYVGKLMFLLQRAHLVQSTRGVQGGYVLAKAAGDLSLAEVFHALEPGELEDVCEKFTGTESACVHSGACALKSSVEGPRQQPYRQLPEQGDPARPGGFTQRRRRVTAC